MIQRFAIVVAVVAAIAALGQSAGATSGRLLAQVTPTPNYIPWYTHSPAPIAGAYAAIGAAFGSEHLYNTGGSAGSAVLDTGECYYICYGAPGVASVNVLAVGNNASSPSPYSFTTLGAPDDCVSSASVLCPGGISDQVFSLEHYASPTATPTVLVAIDANANVGVYNSVFAGTAVIAGAGYGTPAPVPSPTNGSLVSYTGTSLNPNTGEILLGSASHYVRCDFGETTNLTLTCNQPFVVTDGSSSAGINSSSTVWASGGVQPHSTAGGYAPEVFPAGVATAHPQILSGTCSVTAPSTGCTFPGSRTFSSTSYNCTLAPQGTTAFASSYQKTSTSEITIYSGTSATFSYTCM